MLVAVEVVDQADVDAALVRTDQGPAYDVRCLVVEPDVVQRELERLFRGRDEVGDHARDVQRLLSAVGQCVHGDQAA